MTGEPTLPVYNFNLVSNTLCRRKLSGNYSALTINLANEKSLDKKG